MRKRSNDDNPTNPTQKKGGRQSARQGVGGKPRRDWKPAFLKAFEKFANVGAACAVARIHRSTAYDAYDDDPEFRRRWEDAEANLADSVMLEMLKRGRDGILQPVFHKGKRVGSYRKYSDRLLCKLADGLMPDRFGRRGAGSLDDDEPGRVEVSVTVEGDDEDADTDNDEGDDADTDDEES